MVPGRDPTGDAIVIVGFIATALTLFGMYIVGCKSRFGFIVALIGEGFWAWRGFTMHLPDLVILAGIFAVMNTWNYWRWRPRNVDTP